MPPLAGREAGAVTPAGKAAAGASVRATPAGARRRWLAGIALVAALLLLAVAGAAAMGAQALQRQLDRTRALQALTELGGTLARTGAELDLTIGSDDARPAGSGRDARLRPALAGLLARGLGITELTLRRGDGRILASAAAGTVPGGQPVPAGKPDAFADAARALFPAREEAGRLPLPGFGPAAPSGFGADGAGQTPATLEYRLRLPAALPVRDAAVRRLGWLSLATAALAATALLALAMLARERPARMPAGNAARDEGRGASSGTAAATATPAARDGEAQALPPDMAEALDALDQAVLLVDAELRVVALNATAARFTGWSEAQARGQPVYTVFCALSTAGTPVSSPAERCVRENADVPAEELRLKSRADDAERLVEAIATPRRWGRDGAQRGALMHFADIGARVAGREALRLRTRLAESVLDQLGEGVLTTDLDGAVRGASRRVQQLFGYTGEELLRLNVARLLPVPFMNTPGVRIADYARPGATLPPKVAGWRKDATTFPAEIAVKPLHVGEELRLVVIVSDVSERQRSVSLGERLGRLLDHANEEIYIFDAQSLYLQEASAHARKNLGFTAEELSRRSLLGISDGLDASVFEAYLQQLRSGEAEHYTYLAHHRRADGGRYPVEVRLSFSSQEEPPVFMAIAQDITEREAAERRMRQLAHYDLLTGLPNRALLFDRLKQAMVAAERSKRTLAVFFLDLNGFKPINDTYGHEAGDEILKAVAARLAAGLRAGDTVARLGGDEFVVLAPGLAETSDVTALAWKIIELFDEPYALEGKPMRITTSLGITLYPQDGAEPETLLRHADAAMYQSKQAGPGRFQFYERGGGRVTSQRGGGSHTGGRTSRSRQNLAREIRAALTLSQLESRFWPVVPTAEPPPGAPPCLAATQADFRWNHSAWGRIESGEALYAARRSGLDTEVELWLVAEALRQHGRATAAGLPCLPTLVTLTARQWRDPEFADTVADLLEELQAPAKSLILALSREHWPDAASAIPMLWSGLLDAGLRVAVQEPDLGELQAQPLSAIALLLLGPAIAERVLDDGRTQERVRSYAATGLPVVAQGIQSPQQRERLLALGCGHGLGPACGEALAAQKCLEHTRAASVRAL